MLKRFWNVPLTGLSSRRFHQGFAIFSLLTLLLSFSSPLSYYFSSEIPWKFFYGAAYVGALLLLWGKWRILALTLLLAWHWSVQSHFRILGWHSDTWMVILNFGLFFFPPTEESKEKLVAPGARFIQLHLSLMYLMASLGKCILPAWRSGKAMGDFMGSWIFTQPLWVPEGPALTLAWLLILIEGFLAFGLWFRRLQTISFFIALILHGSIFTFTQIKLFSLLILFCHFSYRLGWLEALDKTKLWSRLGLRKTPADCSLEQRTT